MSVQLSSPSQTTDQLVAQILLLAAHASALEIGSSDAAKAARAASRSHGSKGLPAILAAAGEDVGLRFSAVSRSLQEVAGAVHSRSIWVRLYQAGAGWKAVAITDNRGIRLCVDRFDGAGEQQISSGELAREFEAKETAPLDWLAVESAAPLTAAHRSAESKDEHVYHGVSPLIRLRGWLKAEKTDLWVAVIYSIAIGLLSLVLPIAVQSLVNTVAFGTVLQPLAVLTLIVLGGLGFSTVLQAMRTYVVEIIQRRIFVRVSTDAVYRLLRARVDAFDHHHGPELVNRFLEVVTVQKSGAMLLIDGLSIFMQMVSGMLLLAVYHPWLLAYDVVLVICIYIVIFPMSKGAIPTSIKESKAKYELVAWLEEVARFPITFKSLEGARYAVQRTDALVGEYLSYRGKHFRILLRQIVGSLTLHAIASSVLLGVGGLLVINRQLTLGQLIAAELIVTVVVSGFSKFGKQLETFYDLTAAVDKLGYLTDLPLEKSGSEILDHSDRPASAEFKGVSFAYGNCQVLKEVQWKVAAGSRIAITGTGKSTFFDILSGLRQPQFGNVEIDSHDLRDLRLPELRAQLSLIRDAEIFHGSVSDNLRLANPDVSTGRMREALAAIGLLDEIQALPEGIHTELQTGGAPLTPGQVSRLMIARAALARPRILILDGCLDPIDSPAQRAEILDFLFARHQPWTLLIATRERDALERCDAVYSIQNKTLALVNLTK